MRYFLLAVFSAGSISVGVIYAECNKRAPEIEHWCLEPFTPCEKIVDNGSCDQATGDFPSHVVPGCEYTGVATDDCDLDTNSVVECNRVVDCGDGAGGFCASMGEPTETPSYHGLYGPSAECPPTS